MSHVITISKNKTPLVWKAMRNCIESIQKQFNIDSIADIEDTIDREYDVKIGRRIIQRDNTYSYDVDFITSENFTIFLLRWS